MKYAHAQFGSDVPNQHRFFSSRWVGLATSPSGLSLTVDGGSGKTVANAGSTGQIGGGVNYTISDQYSYTQAGLVTKKRLAVSAHLGNPLTTVNLDTTQTYDNEGKVLTVSYPNAGPTYTTAYDAMGRPISLTDNQPIPETWANNVQYGLSGELLQITYGAYYNQYTETRTYNSRFQLTSVGSMQYTYSPTQNNGQITRQNDSASGEEATPTTV